MKASSKIRILPEETVNRVAAGEVVERPAAALKELIENSLDAGAAQVDVELLRSGKGLIRIADDGCGLGHDDLVLALERHATSKIATIEDLAQLATFGFRGEALSSIAAVSRLRIDTRERGERAGTRLEAEGGRILRVAPCGCPEGTTIEVRDLFHTVPARLKFLRSDGTELGHCLQVASRLALSQPRLGLALRQGGRDLLRMDPASDIGVRLRDYLGRDFFAGLLPVRGAGAAAAVAGYLSRPGAGRPGPDYQQFFVNSRPVRDALLAQGLRDDCRDHFLQAGGGISYFLWIDLPPEDVDVNVHPTKREVRFRDLGAVRAVVGSALREALRADRSAWLPAAINPTTSEVLGVETTPQAAEALLASRYATATAQPPLPLAGPPSGTAPQVAAPGPEQLFGTYLVCPGPDGLVLVDQHAAHERVLYERFLGRSLGAGSQQLIEPILLDLAAGEQIILATLQPGLAALGVIVEPFGARCWRVRALPAELPAGQAETFVREMIALPGTASNQPEEFRHRAAALLACHSAIRAHQRLAPVEIAALLADLARTENPGACPHGRPTSVTIDRAEIERRFKRT